MRFRIKSTSRAAAAPRASVRKRCRYQLRGRSIAALVFFGVAVLSGCTAIPAAPAPEPGIVLQYESTAQGLLRSTLRLSADRNRVSAVTQLAHGTCLMEDVRFDSSGRVLEGKASVTAADSNRSRDIIFDVAHGAVDITTPRFHTRWRVPHDLPWAWTSLLSEQASGAPVATPLGAIIAARAPSAYGALRWLDTAAFESHTIMVDQVLVPDDDSVTVVLGDDWADLKDTIPTRLHLATLHTFLQADDGTASAATVIACQCADRNASRRPPGC